MNISQIIIRNILGVRELTIEPGAVTEIRGRNGSGKSSILGAIRAALGASEFTPAQLIHQGEEQGEIVLVLDSGVKVHRRVKPDGTDVKVVDQDGNKFTKPQGVLDALYKISQVNPLRLLATDKKSRDERVRTVIECIPMTVDREKLVELAPDIASQVSMIDTRRHGLEVIDDVYKRLFERRTDINRDIKKLVANIMELKSTLPAPTDEDPTQRLAELRSKKAELDAKREAYMLEFESQRSSQREVIIKQHAAEVQSAEAERTEALRRINEQYERRIQDADKAKDLSLANIEQLTLAQRDEKQRAYEQRMTPITAEMARLEEQSRNITAIESQRKILARYETEHGELAVKSDALTSQLEALKDYRIESLNTFPIEGLEIRDGEVYYNGLTFDQLNTAKRITLAVELAAVQAGDLAVICVDGCEALDAETFTMLTETCQARGLQMICTAVDDTPLSINTHEVAA